MDGFFVNCVVCLGYSTVLYFIIFVKLVGRGLGRCFADLNLDYFYALFLLLQYLQ